MSLKQKIKWWWERVNGRLPECDCWEYKDTLIDNIRQGLEYLLRPDSDLMYFSSEVHDEKIKRLQFVLDFCKDYQELEKTGFYVSDETYEDVAPIRQLTKKEWQDWEKRKNKAFKILGEELYGLWD